MLLVSCHELEYCCILVSGSLARALEADRVTLAAGTCAVVLCCVDSVAVTLEVQGYGLDFSLLYILPCD